MVRGKRGMRGKSDLTALTAHSYTEKGDFEVAMIAENPFSMPSPDPNANRYVQVKGNIVSITPPGEHWNYEMSLAEFEHAGAFLKKLRHLRSKHWFTPAVQDEFMISVERAFSDRFGVNFHTVECKKFDWDKNTVTDS